MQFLLSNSLAIFAYNTTVLNVLVLWQISSSLSVLVSEIIADQIFPLDSKYYG